jgi:hypothetical protein
MIDARLGCWDGSLKLLSRILIDRLFMNRLFRAGLEQLYEGMLLAALSQKDPGEIRVRNIYDLVCYSILRIWIRSPLLF